MLVVVCSEKDLSDNEELYDKVYQEEDDEIYEDLCSTRRRKTRREREGRESVCIIPVFYFLALLFKGMRL